jgi:hypothetical protein
MTSHRSEKVILFTLASVPCLRESKNQPPGRFAAPSRFAAEGARSAFLSDLLWPALCLRCPVVLGEMKRCSSCAAESVNESSLMAESK